MSGATNSELFWGGSVAVPHMQAAFRARRAVECEAKYEELWDAYENLIEFGEGLWQSQDYWEPDSDHGFTTHVKKVAGEDCEEAYRRLYEALYGDDGLWQEMEMFARNSTYGGAEVMDQFYKSNPKLQSAYPEYEDLHWSVEYGFDSTIY